MIIILTGACSTGKTTTARALTHLIPFSAHIDVDKMIPWMPDKTLTEIRDRNPQLLPELINEFIAATVQTLAAGEITCIIDWCFPGEADFEALIKQLQKAGVSPIAFSLQCSLVEHIRRDQSRKPEEQIGEGGVKYFSGCIPQKGTRIITDNMSPAEVAAEILADPRLQVGHGGVKQPGKVCSIGGKPALK